MATIRGHDDKSGDMDILAYLVRAHAAKHGDVFVSLVASVAVEATSDRFTQGQNQARDLALMILEHSGRDSQASQAGYLLHSRAHWDDFVVRIRKAISLADGRSLDELLAKTLKVALPPGTWQRLLNSLLDSGVYYAAQRRIEALLEASAPSSTGPSARTSEPAPPSEVTPGAPEARPTRLERPEARSHPNPRTTGGAPLMEPKDDRESPAFEESVGPPSSSERTADISPAEGPAQTIDEGPVSAPAEPVPIAEPRPEPEAPVPVAGEVAAILADEAPPPTPALSAEAGPRAEEPPPAAEPVRVPAKKSPATRKSKAPPPADFAERLDRAKEAKSSVEDAVQALLARFEDVGQLARERDAERVHLLGRIEAAEADRDRLAAEASALRAGSDEAARDSSRWNARIEALERDRDAARDRARRLDAELQAEREERSRQADQARERVADLAAKLAKAEEDLAHADRAAADAAQQADLRRAGAQDALRHEIKEKVLPLLADALDPEPAEGLTPEARRTRDRLLQVVTALRGLGVKF